MASSNCSGSMPLSSPFTPTSFTLLAFMALREPIKIVSSQAMASPSSQKIFTAISFACCAPDVISTASSSVPMLKFVLTYSAICSRNGVYPSLMEYCSAAIGFSVKIFWVISAISFSGNASLAGFPPDNATIPSPTISLNNSRIADGFKVCTFSENLYSIIVPPL